MSTKNLLVPFEQCRCHILMNASIFNNNPKETIVPPWLLPCLCRNQKCHYNLRFKPNLIYVKGLLYKSNLPIDLDNNSKIQFIEFSYYNYRFSPKIITTKWEKYQSLIKNITNREWNVDSLIVIILGANTHSFNENY